MYVDSTIGLARVGARAALRLALSLVRRAWRCGEDADVCSALLKDALDAVRALPDAALFAGAGAIAAQAPRSQKIWAEVVDSAAKFLHQVVAGYVLIFFFETSYPRMFARFAKQSISHKY